jgi:hypothetical protein
VDDEGRESGRNLWRTTPGPFSPKSNTIPRFLDVAGHVGGTTLYEQNERIDVPNYMLYMRTLDRNVPVENLRPFTWEKLGDLLDVLVSTTRQALEDI